jgi:ParB family chromosome partitioning protein
LEAVQAFAPDHVKRLEKVKKAELASEAERLVAGTGWLPPMFRSEASNDAAQAQHPDEVQDENVEGDVHDDALAVA